MLTLKHDSDSILKFYHTETNLTQIKMQLSDNIKFIISSSLKFIIIQL